MNSKKRLEVLLAEAILHAPGLHFAEVQQKFYEALFQRVGCVMSDIRNMLVETANKILKIFVQKNR